MLITLNPQLTFHVFKEGIAFFNTITGDTFFMPAIFAPIIAKLELSPCSLDQLVNDFSTDTDVEVQLTPQVLEQFITDTKNSGIVTTTEKTTL